MRIKWNGGPDCDYRGLRAQQNPNAFEVFERFLSQERFDHVIELGTSYGGFALFLHDQSLKHGFRFTTYDWSGFNGGGWATRRDPLMAMFGGKLPFDFRDRNVLDAGTQAEIIGLLGAGRCLLLCDAMKVEEFNLLAPHLGPGSYIMAHDYAPTLEHFERITRAPREGEPWGAWGWCEITDADLRGTLDAGIVSKSPWYDEFLEVVWLSCHR